MKSRIIIGAAVVVLALVVAAMGVNAAGQAGCGSGCAMMKAQASCGAAGGGAVKAKVYQAEKPLDRGNVVLMSRTCPQSGQTMMILAVKATSGQIDSSARLTAQVEGKSVKLAQMKPGVYQGQAALSNGTHQLVVNVAQGVAQTSVGFALPVSSAVTAGACAKAACSCGPDCQCGADCKCPGGKCDNAACECGEKCTCGAACKCADGKCSCPADGKCTCPAGKCANAACGCGEQCTCGAGGKCAAGQCACPPAASGGCTPEGRPEDCPQ